MAACVNNGNAKAAASTVSQAVPPAVAIGSSASRNGGVGGSLAGEIGRIGEGMSSGADINSRRSLVATAGSVSLPVAASSAWVSGVVGQQGDSCVVSTSSKVRSVPISNVGASETEGDLRNSNKGGRGAGIVQNGTSSGQGTKLLGSSQALVARSTESQREHPFTSRPHPGRLERPSPPPLPRSSSRTSQALQPSSDIATAGASAEQQAPPALPPPLSVAKTTVFTKKTGGAESGAAVRGRRQPKGTAAAHSLPQPEQPNHVLDGPLPPSQSPPPPPRPALQRITSAAVSIPLASSPRPSLSPAPAHGSGVKDSPLADGEIIKKSPPGIRATGVADGKPIPPTPRPPDKNTPDRSISCPSTSSPSSSSAPAPPSTDIGGPQATPSKASVHPPVAAPGPALPPGVTPPAHRPPASASPLSTSATPFTQEKSAGSASGNFMSVTNEQPTEDTNGGKNIIATATMDEITHVDEDAGGSGIVGGSLCKEHKTDKGVGKDAGVGTGAGTDALGEKEGVRREDGSDDAGGAGTGSFTVSADASCPPALPGRSRKRGRDELGFSTHDEVIRPVGAPVQAPFLEMPDVSESDVGKMVLSETSRGTLTGVVEKFAREEDGFGVWSIRYEDGYLREMDDCGELHDDMCAYFEFAGNATFASGKQVRTRKLPMLQEEVRASLFHDERSAFGRRVCVVRDKVVREGQVTKYVPPTKDGEIEQWRVTYADGEHEDMDAIELMQPLLNYVERRIEQREVDWGHRKILVYMHRTWDGSRPFTTLSGISATLPKTRLIGWG